MFSPAYLIYHPDSVKHVLQENHRNYNKDVLTYKLFRPFLDLGLVTNDGESWLHQRRLIQPAFHRKRLAAYGTLMTGAALVLLERWQARAEGDAPLEVEEEKMRLTLSIVGQALFSMDLSHETSTVGPAVTTLVKLLGDYLYAPFPPLSIPTPRNRRMLAAQRDLRLPQELAKLDRFACVMLDDIGYVQHDRDEMEILFTFLAERYERKSVMITTNLVWSRMESHLQRSHDHPGGH